MIHPISRNVPQGLISATYHHPSMSLRRFCVRGSFLNRSTHLVAPCLASSSIACWIKWTSAWTSLCCSSDVPCILISVHRALSLCPWTKCHLGDSGINGTAHHQLWHRNIGCEYARDLYTKAHYQHRKHKLRRDKEAPLKSTICGVGQSIRHPVADGGTCAYQHILNGSESLSLLCRESLGLPYWDHRRVQSGSHPSHDPPDDKLSWRVCSCLNDSAGGDQDCAD